MDNTKVLIVEDEAIIAMEIDSYIKDLGYSVTSIVNNGKQAIKKAEEDHPDIVLMDIRIKGELDGIDTAEIIKEKFDIPVIFSTAYLDQEKMERAKITTPFGYVLKPVQERDLKVTLEMALYVSKVDKQRRKAEDLLRESRQKLLFHLENTPVGAIEFDLEGKILSWNLAAEKIFGFTKEEIIGQSTFDYIIPKEIHNDMTSKWKTILAGESITSINDNITKSDKRIICKWFNTRLFDNKSNVIGVASLCEDITERHKAEHLSKKSEKYLTDIIKTIPFPFYIINVKSKEIQHTSYPVSNDSTPQLCHTTIHNNPSSCGSETHPCPIDIILKTKQSTVVEHIHLSSDGSEKQVKIHASPLFDEDGEVEFIVETIIDPIELMIK